MRGIKESFDALPKDSRRNIVMMSIIIILFIIGIIVRWDYISKELKGSADHYKELFTRDSIKNDTTNLK